MYTGRFVEESLAIKCSKTADHRWTQQISVDTPGRSPGQRQWHVFLHISQLVNSCLAALRQICSIRHSLPISALSALATSFILTRVDYCNVVLAGMPQCELATTDRREWCSMSDCRCAEIWPRHPSAKRFALAAGARKYHIQAVSSDVQMSQRLSTASVSKTPASRRPGIKA